MNEMGMTVDADGRWILGKKTARPCPHCGAEPERTVARNGRAEIWHRPLFCCEKARQHNARMRALEDRSEGPKPYVGGGE